MRENVTPKLIALIVLALSVISGCAHEQPPPVVVEGCSSLTHYCPRPEDAAGAGVNLLRAVVKTNRFLEDKCGAAKCAPSPVGRVSQNPIAEQLSPNAVPDRAD